MSYSSFKIKVPSLSMRRVRLRSESSERSISCSLRLERSSEDRVERENGMRLWSRKGVGPSLGCVREGMREIRLGFEAALKGVSDFIVRLVRRGKLTRALLKQRWLGLAIHQCVVPND